MSDLSPHDLWLAEVSAVDWIIGIILLIPVLLAASASGDDTPIDPREKILRRHAWEKMVREEEREGVRPPRDGATIPRDSDRPEPQAKWSNRR